MKRAPRSEPPPPGVVEGIKHDLAKVGVGKAGKIDVLSDKWGVTKKVIQGIQAREKFEINQLREMVSEAGFEVAGHALARIQEDLADDKRMSETPLKDKATAFEKVVNAATVALDGHRPMVQVMNFAAIKKMDVDVGNYDRLLAEKRAKAIVIP